MIVAAAELPPITTPMVRVFAGPSGPTLPVGPATPCGPTPPFAMITAVDDTTEADTCEEVAVARIGEDVVVTSMVPYCERLIEPGCWVYVVMVVPYAVMVSLDSGTGDGLSSPANCHL